MPRWLVVLGDASYATYLTHVLLLKIASVLIVPQDWGQSGKLLALILVLLLQAFGLVFYYFIEKPLIALCRRAIADRASNGPPLQNQREAA